MSYLKLIYTVGVFFLLLFSTACGLKEGVVQKDTRSYLWFTGQTEKAIVYIDDLNPITLDKNDNTHYEISPGQHRIIVKKSGEEVVNRVVLLGNGAVREIRIP